MGMYTVIHLGRHPGGYVPLYTPREAPWWVYDTLTQGGTLVGIYLSCTLERHPGGYIPFLPLREAPWWVYTP